MIYARHLGGSPKFSLFLNARSLMGIAHAMSSQPLPSIA
jgi:hypothetical protein